MHNVYKLSLALGVLLLLNFAACVAREGAQSSSSTVEASASTMTLEAARSTPTSETLLGKTSLQVLSVALLPGFASPTVSASFVALQDTAPIEVGSFFVCELVFDDGSAEKLDAILSPNADGESAGQFQVRFPAALVAKGAHVRVLLTGSAKTAEGWQPFDMATFESQNLEMTN